MPENTLYKTCTTCKQEKPTTEFYPHKLCANGLRPTCKDCGKLSMKQYRQTERGKALHYLDSIRYRRTKQGRKVIGDGWKRYAKKHPEKIKAVKFVDAEIRAGRLQRPTVCSKCGTTGMKIEAHHNLGYNREHWLDIIWLCVPCHKFTHRETR